MKRRKKLQRRKLHLLRNPTKKRFITMIWTSTKRRKRLLSRNQLRMRRNIRRLKPHTKVNLQNLQRKKILQITTRKM